MGRIIEEKGIFEALDAFGQLRRELPHIQFVIAGEGPALGALKARSQEAGFSDSVKFLGFATGDVKARALRDSSVFVLPSAWPEGLPVALLESMASGLPVIVSSAGAMSEIVKDGVNGFIVAPRDSRALYERMRLLASDPRLRGRIGRANRRYIEAHFGPQRQQEAMSRLYRGLLAG